ncbi:MAG: T9SS type A sorting domain-containing protein [Candidatus Cloacimonadales bacterium]|jgi:hypothetical protein|nr:T9SS type A sorting domain-containing protein [Candidatus Cloacimonadota bacterium]MDD3501330.1 T9SS type A sorting domain-containing protein [Candidatus Cloacimonadota bacterium]MDX9977018.1 T9SS type A sorting domain-containing protein [Candidatus Cloacimonadales bacterium]
MKKILILITFALMFVIVAAHEVIVLNSGSETLSLVDLTAQTTINNFAQTGLYGNQVYYVDDELWLVNSGDNNIQKIDTSNGNILQTVQLPSSSSPWSIIKKDNYFYVSGMMSGNIYRINAINNEINAAYSGISPEGMLIVGNELFVANTGFEYPNYNQGYMSVFDLITFEKTYDIPTSINPQAMILASDGLIHLMCTGNYFDVEGIVQLISPSSKEIVGAIEIGGCPNSIIESPEQNVYLADGMGLGFYVYNVNTHEIINSSTNPSFNGGSKILFLNGEKLVLKTGDWFSNSHLLHIGIGDDEIYDYAVGVGAIDLAIIENPQSYNDIVAVKESLIEVYPNPFTTKININTKKHQVEELVIYNVKGEKVKVLQSDYWDGRDMYQQRCSAGIYYVLAKTQDGVRSAKRIILMR